MKKLIFLLTVGFAVSLSACKKDDEGPTKLCLKCPGSPAICEGDTYDGETMTKEDLEIFKALFEALDTEIECVVE